jgi:hypothetical protein
MAPSDGVDATRNQVQTPSAKPVIDGACGESEPDELIPRDHAMLSPNQLPGRSTSRVAV